MMQSLRFSTWAQPVTSRPWAIVTVALETLYRATGGRMFGASKHGAWERAVGVS
jgi:hypothetical protein